MRLLFFVSQKKEIRKNTLKKNLMKKFSFNHFFSSHCLLNFRARLCEKQELEGLAL
jgi:hypothetical protein